MTVFNNNGNMTDKFIYDDNQNYMYMRGDNMMKEINNKLMGISGTDYKGNIAVLKELQEQADKLYHTMGYATQSDAEYFHNTKNDEKGFQIRTLKRNIKLAISANKLSIKFPNEEFPINGHISTTGLEARIIKQCKKLLATGKKSSVKVTKTFKTPQEEYEYWKNKGIKGVNNHQIITDPELRTLIAYSFVKKELKDNKDVDEIYKLQKEIEEIKNKHIILLKNTQYYIDDTGAMITDNEFEDMYCSEKQAIIKRINEKLIKQVINKLKMEVINQLTRVNTRSKELKGNYIFPNLIRKPSNEQIKALVIPNTDMTFENIKHILSIRKQVHSKGKKINKEHATHFIKQQLGQESESPEDMARRLLKDGMSVRKVAEATNMSKSKVGRIRKQMKDNDEL